MKREPKFKEVRRYASTFAPPERIGISEHRLEQPRNVEFGKLSSQVRLWSNMVWKEADSHQSFSPNLQRTFRLFPGYWDRHVRGAVLSCRPQSDGQPQ